MKSIEQLTALGFKVTKNKNITTTVEHEKKFVVTENGVIIASILNESTNKYTITFSGLCSDGLVPKEISFDNTSLLSSINESSNQVINKRVKSRALPPVQHLPTTFKQILIGETFYKEMTSKGVEGKIAYKKISETTASKVEGIASILEIFLDESDSVFTDYSDQHNMLTQDQKWDLVFAYPEDTPDLQLRTLFMNDLDFIPGVEDLSDVEKSKMVDELVVMWKHHNNK